MKTKFIALAILVVFTTGCTAREIGLSAVGAATLIASLFVVEDIVNKDKRNNENVDDNSQSPAYASDYDDSQYAAYNDYNDSQYNSYNNDNDEYYTKPPSKKPLKTLPKNEQSIDNSTSTHTASLDKKPKKSIQSQDLEYQNAQSQSKPIKKATKNLNDATSEKYPHES